MANKNSRYLVVNKNTGELNVYNKKQAIKDSEYQYQINVNILSQDDGFATLFASRLEVGLEFISLINNGVKGKKQISIFEQLEI